MNAPVDPHDPYLRTYTEPEVTALLRELHERGRPLGLRWGSAAVAEPTIDGRLLVDFGDAPVSTLLNLLTLLREAAPG
ncbi:hypothetical protein [Kitasatospora purpeofusca]|uniref:hypothetical protein n=1 Tax=Kitasatospora purpeofusca TaxID=67352 RepID=UPI00225765CA|nr:hypothetical protein [Kitasatospora purpeofusca]MCX4754347.1 hypothetical protein [Kitasatospora purpeofusca]WSR33775.1 hypothetical protein OG715_24030 [Kitasatospora purpeofusca]